MNMMVGLFPKLIVMLALFSLPEHALGVDQCPTIHWFDLLTYIHMNFDIHTNVYKATLPNNGLDRTKCASDCAKVAFIHIDQIDLSTIKGHILGQSDCRQLGGLFLQPFG